MTNSNNLFPLDAAHILLGAANSSSHYPLLCALLTERAAACFFGQDGCADLHSMKSCVGSAIACSLVEWHSMLPSATRLLCSSMMTETGARSRQSESRPGGDHFPAAAGARIASCSPGSVLDAEGIGSLS